VTSQSLGVRGDDESDYFVHKSSVNTEASPALSENQKVTFNVEGAEKGPKAVNVIVND
jgi:CspA family cold shock protein